MRREPSPEQREREAVSALAACLAETEGRTLRAVAAAIDRDANRLSGGSWGSREDGEGCLLSLAAWELGLPDGETLMRGSVNAVRLPALFDEAWGLMVRRTGDVEEARRVMQRLVRMAVARLDRAVLDDEPGALVPTPPAHVGSAPVPAGSAEPVRS